MTIEYLHYTALDDWEANDVVVVHILDSEMARVRTHIPDRQSHPQPIEDAFGEAHRMLREYPYIKRVGVFLDEDATWNHSWGDLKPAV